jgi:membrane protein
MKIAEVMMYYARGILRKVRDDDILFLASGLAFNCILTMIPLMLLAASALGVFLNSSDLGVRQLEDVLDAIFPPQPFAQSIKQSIITAILDIIRYRTSLGLFGAAVLVWTGTSLFDAIRSVLHVVFGIKKTRGVIQSILHHIGFVFLLFLLLVATNVSLWLVTLFERVVLSIPAMTRFDVSSFTDVIPTAIVVVLTGCMFYIVYRHIPDSQPPRTAAVISTTTTTIVWVISGKLFALYLSSFSAIGKIYGPYAFILVLLIWIYYSSVIFVLGGIVGQLHWERRRSVLGG